MRTSPRIGRLLLAASLLPSAALAQSIIDVNPSTTPFASAPSNGAPALTGAFTDALFELNGGWLFTADDQVHGRELWFTDGTPAGTQLLADIQAGANGSNPTQLTRFGSRAVFVAFSGSPSDRLWVTDGTAAGTQPFGSTDLSALTVAPGDLVESGGKLYFRGVDQAHGSELWVADDNGVQLVADIVPGPEGAIPREMVAAPGGGVWYSGEDAAGGRELWFSDGTAAGTQRVVDIQPGPEDSFVGDLFVWQGQLYFGARLPATGWELFVSDGTAAGTTQLADLEVGPSSSFPDLRWATEFGGELHFITRHLLGPELYRTNGTTVTSIEFDPTRSLETLGIQIFGGELFAITIGATPDARQLWRYDGTTVSLVADIGAVDHTNLAQLDGLLWQAHGTLWFAADTPGKGVELWRSDGTPAGTQLAVDFDAGLLGSLPNQLTDATGGQLIVTAETAQTGRELWFVDATTGSASLLDLAPGSASGSGMPAEGHFVDGRTVYFAADDGVHGRELHGWSASQGLALVADIAPELGSSPRDLFSAWTGAERRTFFTASPDGEGRFVYVTDGTPAGTSMLPGGGSAFLTFGDPEFTEVAGRVVFVSNTFGIARLVTTDGTQSGTQVLAEAPTLPASFVPTELTALGDELLFVGSSTLAGNELWKADLQAGTVAQLANIGFGAFSSDPAELTPFAGQVAFAATGLVDGRELWLTDGTPAGTVRVADLVPGAAGSAPEALHVHRGELYFTATTAATGRELWKLSAPGAQPVLVADLAAGSASTIFGEFASSGGGLYFTADEGVHGMELWRTQGVPGDAVLVADLLPGSPASDPQGLEPVGEGVYFVAASPGIGRELHLANGALVTPVFDLVAGAADGNVTELMAVDGRLLFVGETTSLGVEWLSLDISGATVRELGGSATGVRLSATPPRLGGTLEMRVDRIPASAPLGALVYSGFADANVTPLLLPGEASWLDPFTAQVAAIVTGGPSAVVTRSVPALPALIGTQLHLQGVFFPGGAFPAVSTNGLDLVLGL